MAFDPEVLGQHRVMLHRFLLFLTRDPNAAEDLVQETYRTAAQRGTDPNKGEDYGAWLRAIARNHVRNYRRRQQRWGLLLVEGFAEIAEHYFVESGADQEAWWEARKAALRQCLAEVPPEERELLLRRYRGDEQVRDLAGAKGLEPNTLSKRLERLREALRQCIERRLKASKHDG